MRKLLFCSLLGLAIAQAGFALLPPYYQSVIELSAILKDQRLGQSLENGEAIVSIQRNNDGYLITTPRHSLQVDVLYQNQDHPGPAKFDLNFQNPKAIESSKSKS